MCSFWVLGLLLGRLGTHGSHIDHTEGVTSNLWKAIAIVNGAHDCGLQLVRGSERECVGLQACTGVWCTDMWCTGMWCTGVWCTGVWCAGVWCAGGGPRRHHCPARTFWELVSPPPHTRPTVAYACQYNAPRFYFELKDRRWVC